MLSKNIIHILNDGVIDSVSPDTHLLACFVINDIVVDNNVFSREFFEMFHNSIIKEDSILETGEVLVSFTNKDSGEIQGVVFDERQGAIVVSNPLLVEVPENSRWVEIGSKYIDGVFYP
jgi:hypothetical protein